jgi:putative FmdB family regulatory protein
MPVRNYQCIDCGFPYRKLLQGGDDKKAVCPECGTVNEPELVSSVSATVYETKDKRRGKKHMKNQEGLMKKRMREHHDRYELAEKIDKYGMDDAKRYGWDKKIKKT